MSKLSIITAAVVAVDLHLVLVGVDDPHLLARNPVPCETRN